MIRDRHCGKRRKMKKKEESSVFWLSGGKRQCAQSSPGEGYRNEGQAYFADL